MSGIDYSRVSFVNCLKCYGSESPARHHWKMAVDPNKYTQARADRLKDRISSDMLPSYPMRLVHLFVTVIEIIPGLGFLASMIDLLASKIFVYGQKYQKESKQSEEPALDPSEQKACQIISKEREDEIRKLCKKWMQSFSNNFEPRGVKKYKMSTLYKKDLGASEQEKSDIKEFMDNWSDENKRNKEVPFGTGWTKHSGSVRSLNIENQKKHSGYIFKTCLRSCSIGLPSAHFLRVPKGKEIQSVIEKENCDELEVIEESLIALKPKDEIVCIKDLEQSYYFVVKSKKINLFNANDTINLLSSYSLKRQIEIATQVMKVICQTGLGDVHFSNFQINKDTGKLTIVDTEPLYASLMLDMNDDGIRGVKKQYNEKKYKRSQEIANFINRTNGFHALSGIRKMIKRCPENRLPVFKKVAEIYEEVFLEQFPEKSLYNPNFLRRRQALMVGKKARKVRKQALKTCKMICKNYKAHKEVLQTLD